MFRTWDFSRYLESTESTKWIAFNRSYIYLSDELSILTDGIVVVVVFEWKCSHRRFSTATAIVVSYIRTGTVLYSHCIRDPVRNRCSDGIRVRIPAIHIATPLILSPVVHLSPPLSTFNEPSNRLQIMVVNGYAIRNKKSYCTDAPRKYFASSQYSRRCVHSFVMATENYSKHVNERMLVGVGGSWWEEKKDPF